MDVKIHSTKKHRVLGYYFSAIRSLVSSPKMPFKKLYYVDLYCGDGEYKCEERGEARDSPIIDSLLKPAKRKGINLYCILNDIDSNRIAKLKNKTKDYQNFILEYGIEDANSYYKKALKYIPLDKLSIFLLDPSNHDDLKWSTIEGISKHISEYNYKGEKRIRRPELIINLMTYTMLGSYKAKSYDSIDEALGTHDWYWLIEENRINRIKAPVETALLTTFIEQLKKLGYKVPTPIGITNTYPENEVYYLIFGTTNEKGYKIIQEKLIPYIMKNLEKWQKENKIDAKKAKARELGVSSLDKWI